VLEALAYLHANGIVHRDVKLDNILLSIDTEGNYHPYLIDFGIATTMDERRNLSKPCGTPGFTAPEVF
jgi:serine/threonine protein kinase